MTAFTQRCRPLLDEWRTRVAGRVGSFLTLFLLLFVTATSFAQRGPRNVTIEKIPFAQPAANMDQARNGTAASPTTPVAWVNGNLGSSNSHYQEGQSAPYRAVLTDLPLGGPITVVIGFDIKHSDKNALDYLTSYNRLLPHNYGSHTTPEVINPIFNVAGITSADEGSPFPLPAPTSVNSPVANQPTLSFNSLSPGERQMSIWGGTITAISYVNQGNLTLAQSAASIKVTFTPAKSTVVLAWGGHIGSRIDWGFVGGVPRSAGGISGSPYHMRFDSWGTNSDGTTGLNTLGNMDLSLSADAITIPPSCTIANAPATACPGGTVNLSGPAPASGQTLTYAWSFVGSANGATFAGGASTATTQNVTVTAGTGDFTVQLITSDNGTPSTNPCTATIVVCPPPVFSNPPSNVTVDCGNIPAVVNVNYSNGSTACPISGSVVPTRTPAPGACGGVITETWSFTDNCGRTISGSRTITVSAAALPTMTAPGNTTVACGGVPAPSTISFSNGLTGGCAISGTSNPSTQTPAPGACGGVITETWTATDACGRALAPVSRVITVSPAALPTMTAPGNVTVACDAIPATSTISFSNGLTGGCAITGTSNVSTQTTPPGSCGGVITETWTATDACGRPLASVSRTITVNPPALPTISNPGNVTVACGNIPAPSTRSFSNGLSGACLVQGTSNISTQTPAPGACGGVVTETWTATDACGRALASISRTITVTAAALPTMTAPANTTVACGAVPAVGTISFTNGLTGNCQISGTSNPSTQTPAPGACGGVITETWTATDACGRALAPVSRTITVSPAALPTMTAPANTTVACGGVPAASTISFSNGLTGGCAINGTSNLSTQTPAPGACGGVVTETWTATDACGRALAPVSRVITVSPAALPTMTAPGNITVSCGTVTAASTISFSNGLTGGCAINGTSNLSTQTPAPGACGGVITETWTATDACGRALASVSRTITVSAAALPTISNPGNTTVACGNIPAPSTRSFSNGLTGGCAINGTSNISTQTPAPGACGGVVTETWTATDVCGRALASISRVITVSPAALPTMTAPANTTVACGGVPASSTISFSNGLTGGCAINGTSNPSTQTPAPGACGGVITETWTATDACGRALAPVSRVITVSPAALPTMTAPANATVACGGVPAPSTISFSNGLTGGCAINGTSNLSTQTPVPGACGGVVTETWTATDACGRALAPVSRVITVSPAALPTMTAPANTTVACGGVPAASTISFSNGLTGGCAINGTSNLSTQTPAPGACGGVVTETWTATDACGRALAPVSRTITVSPAALPTMTAPANTTVACGGVPAPSTISFSNGLTGGCAINGTSNLSTQTPPPGACGGVVTETWTATDACGRALAPVSRVITVSPAPLPTMTNPGNVTVACGNIPAVSTRSFSNGLTGGCLIQGTSNVSTQTPAPGACGGVVTETWTATDFCGRALASISRVITVSPAALPTMTAPANSTVACGGVPAPSTISFSNGLTGGCAINGTSNLSTQTPTPGACGGVVTETWTATDACGRALAPVSRVITVSPAALPTMTAPANTTVACGGVPAPSTISFSNGLTGGCAINGTSNLSTQTPTPGACGGVITETWTATDACGRALAPVSRTITVSPAALPTISNPGNTTVACGNIPAPSTRSFTNGLTGGCLIQGTSNVSTQTPAPGACGGVVTETWTATDLCGRALASISRVITVSPAALPTMTAPANTTVACGNVPAPATISYSNGGSGNCLISGNSNLPTRTEAPGACGGVITETWTATDACGRALAPVSRTITVSPAALPTMTAPANATVNCGGVPAPSTISFSNGLTGGCAINGTSNLSTQTPNPGTCGGVITETWTAADACGRTIASVSRTITVLPAAQAQFVSTPGDITATVCNQPPVASSLNITNGGSGDCLISSSVLSTIQGSGLCGTFTETWSYTDACGRTTTHSRVITVPCCTTFCTYTQGYYGNPGGMACNGTTDNPNTFTTAQTITRAINGAWSGTMRVGKPGKSLTFTAGANGVTPESSDVLRTIDVLPGGGAAKMFTHSGDIAISSIPASYLKNGRINNNLLSQTIALGINMGVKLTLGGLQLEGGTIATAKPIGGCGGTVAKARVCNYDPITGALTSVSNEYDYRSLDAAVVAASVDPSDPSKRTVAGLFALASRALSNSDGLGSATVLATTEDGVSLTAIQNAVDVINNAFDECRVLVGFNVERCPTMNPNFSPAFTGSKPAPVAAEDASTFSKIHVGAFPNPFADVVKFTISSPVSGQAQLEVFNMLGQKVATIYNGLIQANKSHQVDYKVPAEAQQNLIYVLRIGGEQVTGKLLQVRK